MFKDKYSVKKRSSRRIRKPSLMTLAVLVLAGIVLAVLEATNTTHLLHSAKPASEVIVRKGKIATSEPKNNSSSGSSTEKTPTSSNRAISGGTDTNGSATSGTNSSQWTVSASGNITVKQPVADAKLESGNVLSGSAKVSKVNFRLIDNSVGVISEGSFNVVDGNFSGMLNFTSHSSGGRLDVFSTDDQGVEINEVQIAVGF